MIEEAKEAMRMSKQGREWMSQWREINDGTASQELRENPPPTTFEIMQFEIDRVRRGVPEEDADLMTGGDGPMKAVPAQRAVRRFGVLVRAQRTAYGMRRCDLARETRLDDTLIWRIESGKQPARLDHIFALAKALELDPGRMVQRASLEPEYGIAVDNLPD